MMMGKLKEKEKNISVYSLSLSRVYFYEEPNISTNM